jgi:hypothetical protein
VSNTLENPVIIDPPEKSRTYYLTPAPLELKTANAFVERLHRHHAPVFRDKYRVGCMAGDSLVGVIQVGRPVSRVLDDGKTLEVVRCCTDGTKNVCSFLYSRAARIAKELGYSKIITYILDSESGISLKASGWIKEADIKGHSWGCPSRPRDLIDPQQSLFGEKEKYPINDKQRWAKYL